MSEIGDRIRELRGKLLTQNDLAARADVSTDLIRKLEQGRRHSASIASLAAIADALDVTLPELLGKRAAVPSSEPDAGIVAIRRALAPVDEFLDEAAPDGEAITLAEARHADDYAWSAYWGGNYDGLTAVLPTTIAQMRASAHAATGADQVPMSELLARIYWVTGCTLVHLGQTDPAWQAIRLAHDAARAGGDALLDATIRGSAAWQLLVQGRYREAQRLALHIAEDIKPVGEKALPSHLSTYGSLVLQSATSAARAKQPEEARELAKEAKRIAQRTGERRDYECYFGPSQVVMQTVDIGVTTQAYGKAIKDAEEMPAGNRLPLAARCRHLADQALALTRTGSHEKALTTILTAEGMGPEWIKHQSLPRQVVRELVEGQRRRASSSRLGELASRLAVR